MCICVELRSLLFSGVKMMLHIMQGSIGGLVLIARIMNKDNNDRKHINHCCILMDIQELDLRRSLNDTFSIKGAC